MDEFCIALGRFVWIYARTEAILKYLALHEFRLEGDGMAIFGSQRARTIIDMIRRRRECVEDKLPETVSLALEQFVVLTTSRDKLLHSGFADMGDGVFIVSNIAVTPSPDKVFAMDMSVEKLNSMTADCERIHEIIFNASAGKPLEGAPSPWLYTPRQSTPAQGKTQSKKKKQQIQPPTSQG